MGPTTLTKPSNLIELARLNVSKITVRNNDVRATQYRSFVAFCRSGADGIGAHTRSLPGLRLRTDKLRVPRDEQAGLEGGRCGPRTITAAASQSRYIDFSSPSAAAALTELERSRAVHLVSGFERTSCVRHETSKPVCKGGVAAREL